MITGADEYPFHQTADVMAFAGTDRNFYDRFFFNGFAENGRTFFAIAFGLYPQLDIMDGAVCILRDGKQHNIRVSRYMNADRSVLNVGPLSIDIKKPLVSSDIRLQSNDFDIEVDIMFVARHPAMEEPRFTRRIGTRAFMDYTRLTQNVAWSGKICIGGETIVLDPAVDFGTRDRSWGVRPIGNPDSQPPKEGNLSQLFWLWTPCNFTDCVAFSHTNDDEFGRPWNRRAGIQPIGRDLVEFEDVEYDYEWFEGSRRIKSATACLKGKQGTAELKLTTGLNFHMSGLGYTHPVWGHGKDHGEAAIEYDVIDVGNCSPSDPLNLHIQSISTAELTFEGKVRQGIGVVEQLFIGEYEPAGFAEGVSLLPEYQK